MSIRQIQVQFGGNDADSFRHAIAEVNQLAFDKPMLNPPPTLACVTVLMVRNEGRIAIVVGSRQAVVDRGLRCRNAKLGDKLVRVFEDADDSLIALRR